MSQWKENDARNEKEHSHPCGVTRLDRHVVQRRAHHRVQRFACRHRILVSVPGSGAEFNCLGNLTKALAFSSKRAACVAECGVADHAGLIHALYAGHDPGAQQQPALFDQLGYFRETQLGLAEGLCGPVLGGLGHVRILGVHLLHGLFQDRHVIDHRKTAPATVAAMAQLHALAR